MQNMWGSMNQMDMGRAAAAEADADAAWDSAQAAGRNAALWRQNAQEWQTAYEKLDLEGHCRTHAQAALKDAALEELARLVPDHPLLNKEHRKQLHDAAYQKRHDEIVAQRKAEAEKREAERQAALKKAKRKKRIRWTIILAIIAFALYRYHFWRYFL